MASLSRQHAEAVSALLLSFTKPAIPGLTFSPTNDFKVIEARANLHRDIIGDEVNSFVMVGPRVQHPLGTPDRCGMRGAYQTYLNITKKLTTPATETQPASETEMDAVREFAEWVQDILWNNRQVQKSALTSLDPSVMPDWDQLSSGMYIVEYVLEYG